MMPRQADAKQLLKDGLYWEALGLAANSPWGEIDMQIAVLEQQYQRDQEVLVILAAARRDLQSGYYPPAREFCDEISANLGAQFRRRTIEEDTLLWECLWQTHFKDRVSEFKTPQGINRVKSACVMFLRNNAIKLANCAQEEFSAKTICRDVAIQAVDKSISGLETALRYSPRNSDIEEQLNKIREAAAYLYCNRGIEHINQAQQDFNAKMESLVSQKIRGNPNSLMERARSLLEATIKEIRGGIEDIERAKSLDEDDEHIKDQLGKAHELLESFERQRNTQMEPGHNHSEADSFNRGIERINKAIDNWNTVRKALVAKIKPSDIADVMKRMPGNHTTVPSEKELEKILAILVVELGSNDLQRAISEVKAGIADIDKAQKIHPDNTHIEDQLRQVKKILDELQHEANGSIYTPSSSTKASSHQPSPKVGDNFGDHDEGTIERGLKRIGGWLGRKD